MSTAEATQMPPFHLAFPVHSLEAARAFYGELLGCPEGRSSPEWVDFNFYGHQIVAHLSPEEAGHRNTSAVDGDNVPVRHFGAVLSMSQWEQLADKLTAAGTKFVIEPHIRFKGQVGEQATMFFLDPSGNALEFKAFADMASLFAK
jgi:extradiol dioxygenase family protein